MVVWYYEADRPIVAVRPIHQSVDMGMKMGIDVMAMDVWPLTVMSRLSGRRPKSNGTET